MTSASSPVMPPPLVPDHSIAPDPFPPPSGLTLDNVDRLTIDQYEQMARAGMFGDSRVELIEGYVVSKMPPDPPHVSVVELTRAALQPLLPAGWHFREEKPIRLPDDNMHETDLAIVRGTIRDYVTRHPDSDDIAAVVEVAASSVSRDRNAKLAIYAASGIPIYWIVNLIDDCLEIYSEPAPERRIYRSQQILGRTDQASLTIDGHVQSPIAVAELLP